MKIKFRLVLLVCILANAEVLLCQTQSRESTRRTAADANSTAALSTRAVQGSKFDKVSFDDSVKVLPPKYAGHDIRLILEKVKRVPALAPKSEFESNADYERRRSSFASATLYGNLTPSSALAFVVKPDKDSVGYPSSTSTYDADAQMTKVLLIAHPKDESKLESVRIRADEIGEKKYVASNAFGVKVQVIKTYDQEYWLDFDVGSTLFSTPNSFSEYVRAASFTVPMSPDAARRFKSSARILVVCRMVEPWASTSTYNSEATIDSPYAFVTEQSYLRVIPTQVWLFDASTGEVLRKLTESSSH
jgi:hypothetical protein